MDVYDLAAYQEAEAIAVSADLAAFREWWWNDTIVTEGRRRASVRRVLSERHPDAMLFTVATVHRLITLFARQK